MQKSLGTTTLHLKACPTNALSTKPNSGANDINGKHRPESWMPPALFSNCAIKLSEACFSCQVGLWPVVTKPDSLMFGLDILAHTNHGHQSGIFFSNLV